MYVLMYINFLMQRNCHRNIYNQFSRGLLLHGSWQQDWYNGCGKSETAGQDHAGTRWLNDDWNDSEIWYLVLELVGGSDSLQCLWLQQRVHWMVHWRLTWKNRYFDSMFLLSHLNLSGKAQFTWMEEITLMQLWKGLPFKYEGCQCSEFPLSMASPFPVCHISH